MATALMLLAMLAVSQLVKLTFTACLCVREQVKEPHVVHACIGEKNWDTFNVFRNHLMFHLMPNLLETLEGEKLIKKIE